MTEERITETRDPEGNTHTRTTVIQDGQRSGGGSSWVLILLVLVALVVGLVLFTQMGNSEIARDTAIADAANQVGDAAQQVGDAAQDVANDVTNNQ